MSASKILLVHYDPTALQRFRSILETHGFEVSEARDGSAAVAAMLETEPDLILMEAMLPKVHGFEVCEDIKKTGAGRKTPVVLMTTVYKGRKYRNEALHDHGADEYIELPMEDTKFVAVIERSLKNGSGAPSSTPA
ncbi:MAG: PleD family two-component system response regulator [Acidobacteriota bacterium]